MHPKAIVALVNGFDRNYPASLTLERLDLSYNKFDEQGSQAMASWLSKYVEYTGTINNIRVREFSKLKALNLAFTVISVAKIVPWLANLVHLESFNISGNRVDRINMVAIRTFLETTESLTR
jgi:hypothetical protein